MDEPTQGPYRVYFHSENQPNNRHEIVAKGKTIAHIYNTKGDEGPDAANAHLLAASWDMREALEQIEKAALEGGCLALDVIGRAADCALAKVRSET